MGRKCADHCSIGATLLKGTAFGRYLYVTLRTTFAKRHCVERKACVSETDGTIGIVSKPLILILILGISISIGINWGLLSRYQSRYRLGAFLSPGISPGID